MKNNPIGVLDSGVGGLTVLQSIARELPQESIIYIGDSKNAPYGVKSSDEMYLLSKKMIEFLLAQKVKLIVIACNTITVSCLDKFRNEYSEIPIVGTVPVIKTAVAVTTNKRIGILSTTRTAQSVYQKNLITTYADECTVFNHGTNALVPLIEKGMIANSEMAIALQKVLKPFSKEHVDTLVLGCTHFPFLREQIQRLLGDGVQLLDSGGAIARQVKRVLQQKLLLAQQKQPNVIIYTTGNMRIAKKLLNGTIEKQRVVFKEL